ncbi:hypothetical protein B0H14DRAFT_3857671 [Mycena olivaceomarginata]|nr:hypothetical protein B0H14DRAFT_3857671 [Mycena olivaceomarginata]
MTGESLTVWVHPTVPEGFFPVPLPGTDRLNFELGHSVPLFGPPTYEKYRTAPADENVDNPDTAGFLANHLSHLKMLYPMEEWATAVLASTVEVDLLFTAHQIQQLHLVADFSSTSGATSAQGALSAYLITMLNRVLDVPITRVPSIMLEVRIFLSSSFPPPRLTPYPCSGTGTQYRGAHTPLQGLTPTEAASIGAVARTIRASITAAREYAHIKRVVAVSEPIWRRQSEEVLEHQFWPGEGEGRADWSVSYFGYGADKARAVMYGSFADYARIFKASPVKQADGMWTTDPKHYVPGFGKPTTHSFRISVDQCSKPQPAYNKVSAWLYRLSEPNPAAATKRQYYKSFSAANQTDPSVQLWAGPWPQSISRGGRNVVKVNVNDPDSNGWKANAATKNPNDGALRLFVRVPTVVRDAFLAAVAGDLMSPGFPQNLVRREREMQARISEGARTKL